MIQVTKPDDYPQDYQLMITNTMQEVLERFVEKSRDYPPEGFKFLGQKGQFSDLARKFFKLKKVIWDGGTLEGEQVDEICEDMMGHLLILLYLRNTGQS